MSRSIEDRVRQHVGAQLEVALDRVQLESSFVDDLKADSLACVDLTISLEEEFSIDVPDEDIDQLKTVADAVEYIKTHGGK